MKSDTDPPIQYPDGWHFNAESGEMRDQAGELLAWVNLRAGHRRNPTGPLAGRAFPRNFVGTGVYVLAPYQARESGGTIIIERAEG